MIVYGDSSKYDYRRIPRLIIADIPWERGKDYSKLFDSFNFSGVLIVLVDSVLEAFYTFLTEGCKRFHWYYYAVWVHDDTCTYIFGFTHDKYDPRFNILRNDNETETAHPEERPVQLMVDIIEAFAGDGLVFDPFMGSGSSAVAAKRLGNDYIGYEINKQYFDIAKGRLNGRTDK